ncbi:DNA repair protein RecO [Acidihalobacter ferrooxydans]|uniref:DNA repair protein RecO n=1 Tax=Acidihalobacter ferrooxydans TaxID=1765967 RepID=A0A1P8UHQ6_9GAMM|nr:DNA repair protein RecO [Acidihalobacter ferrooxydans]APZ43314.1 DNA repair protein RecO [Acidihalobacter ferrooxydans]
MSELQDEGYVLHARAYRETSLLLEVLTADHGRLGLIARGARRGRGGQAGALQPFHRLQLRWSPRGELHTLTGAEELDRHRLPPAGLPAALYLNELLMRLLTRHDACDEIFQAYARALMQMAAGEALEPVLRDFELDLLDALGYGLTLAYAADGEALDPQARYRYVEQHGAVRTAGQGADTFPGSALLAMAARDWREAQTRRVAKQLLRGALEARLGRRALRTRELLGGLARLRRMADNNAPDL